MTTLEFAALTINGDDIPRGLPVKVAYTADASGVYGRIAEIRGGSITVCTPGGSSVPAGFTSVYPLDAAGMERLRFYEDAEEIPYFGRLTTAERRVGIEGPT